MHEIQKAPKELTFLADILTTYIRYAIIEANYIIANYIINKIIRGIKKC
ncbi:MAG: hypothetical protein PWQ23_922 [Thermoanaerobacter sp.]|jgi:hypothetical protein|nr:hypothetical protein [Thermoanaerobacter sp.]